MERQQNFCASCSVSLSHEGSGTHSRVSANRPHSAIDTADLFVPDGSDDHTQLPTRAAQPPSRARGIETILAWKYLSHLHTNTCYFAETEPVTSALPPSPALDVRELHRLEIKYIHGVHSKNPILNLSDLHDHVEDLARNDLTWSTRICLVALVCAIGAINQQQHELNLSSLNSFMAGSSSVSSPTSYTIKEKDVDLAMQFWAIAAPRMHLAIGQHSIEAVQCLCLAGIWHMHSLEPVQAWHYFNLAGSAWHLIKAIDRSKGEDNDATGNNGGSYTVMQALYFTIWKSVCEIRLELDMPGSFDIVSLPQDFPMPPDRSFFWRSPGIDDVQMIWYYYLTDIAARHQINRIVNTLEWTCDAPSEMEVVQMLTLADTLSEQLESWRLSLPPMLRFDEPQRFTLTPHSNDFTHILRSRYLSCRELVGRCFLWLCIETSCVYTAHVRRRSLEYARQCLQYCMLKLSNVTPHRHQGTWFALRTAAAATLTLCAVYEAKRRPSNLDSQELEMPDEWHTRATRTADFLGPLWKESKGGAADVGRLVREALAHSAPLRKYT